MRAAVVLVGLTAVATAAVARPGKMVRVDRTPIKKRVDVAVCEARSSEITCYGPVEAGDELHGLHTDGSYRLLRVESVSPSAQDRCKVGTPVQVTAQRIQGAAAAHSGGITFRGIEPRPGKSRIVDQSKAQPPPKVGEALFLAVDLSGDGDANLAATMRECREARRKMPGLMRRSGSSYCVTFWQRDSATRPWAARNQIEVHDCQ